MTAGRVLLVVFSGLLIGLPYWKFDAMDVHVLVGLELVLLVAAFLSVRGHRRHVAVAFISLPVFLVAGEVYFRLQHFGLPGLSASYSPAGYGHPLSSLEYDPDTYAGLKPDTISTFRGKTFRVNSDGFRGRQYARKKPAGTLRVVLAGASTCMGSGVADEEVYSAVLERRLNEAGLPKSVEVINLSIGGSKPGNLLHVIENVGMSYEPDMLLLLGNGPPSKKPALAVEARRVRGFDGSRFDLYTDSKFRLFSNRFFFARVIRLGREGRLDFGTGVTSRRAPSFLLAEGGAVPAAEMREESRTTVADAAMIHQVLSRLSAIAGTVPATVYLIKPMEHLGVADHDRTFRTFMAGAAHEHGLGFIDTHEIDFSGYTEKQLLTYLGDNHPNAVGHGLYAEKMFVELLPILERLSAS